MSANIHLARITALSLAILMTCLASVAQAQTLPPLTVQRLPVISLDLRAGSTEKQSKRVTYTPPPGWYIRSHSVVCTHRQGNVSYLVSTVPAGWAWSSEKQLTDSYRKSIEGAAQAYNVGGQGKLQNERDAHVYAVRHTSSSHHALVVDVSAVGEGMFRGASEIQLTVIAELVYVGTNRPQLGFSAPDRPNQTP